MLMNARPRQNSVNWVFASTMMVATNVPVNRDIYLLMMNTSVKVCIDERFDFSALYIHLTLCSDNSASTVWVVTDVLANLNICFISYISMRSTSVKVYCTNINMRIYTIHYMCIYGIKV